MTTTTTHPFAAIILAAGKGTRMRSDTHKVLHTIAGRAMLEHLMASVAELGPERTAVVVGAGRDQIEKAVGERAATCLQEPQLGTAHAVQQAEGALADFSGDVLVLYGDVPFVKAATMRAMLERLHGDDNPAAVVLGFVFGPGLAAGSLWTVFATLAAALSRGPQADRASSIAAIRGCVPSASMRRPSAVIAPLLDNAPNRCSSSRAKFWSTPRPENVIPSMTFSRAVNSGNK